MRATEESSASDYYDNRGGYDRYDLDDLKDLFREKILESLTLKYSALGDDAKKALAVLSENLTKVGYDLTTPEELWEDLRRSESFKEFFRTYVTRYDG